MMTILFVLFVLAVIATVVLSLTRFYNRRQTTTTVPSKRTNRYIWNACSHVRENNRRMRQMNAYQLQFHNVDIGAYRALSYARNARIS